MSNDDTTTPTEDNLKQLREAADRGRQVPQLERELAFVKAGIDTDSKLGKMLLATYDGELTREALRAEATEIGLFKDAGPATPPPTSPDPLELAQQREQQRMRETLQQGAPSGDEPPATADPYDDALGNFNADRKKGMPRENAQVAAVDRILMAAGSGDARVIHRPGR